MIISIDVGIKNLSYCIFTIINKKLIIYDWDIINLIDNTKQILCNQNTKCNNKCCNKAIYNFRNTQFYCRIHSKSSNYKIANTEYYKVENSNKCSLKRLNKLGKLHDLEKNNIIEKSQVLDYISDNFLLQISKTNTKTNTKKNKINMITIAKSLKDSLNNNKYINQIKTVLIENQIGPLASNMKCIQAMITQYFVMNNVRDIVYISALNKLKNYDVPKKTYQERKKSSIKVVSDIFNNSIFLNQINRINRINQINEIDKWKSIFNTHKKKDDLADSLLQGLWYIETNNSI